jgi:hypothetical protein
MVQQERIKNKMERKKKICIICNEDKYIFSKKRCLECSKIDYAKKALENKERKAYYIPKITEKTKLKNKEKSDIRSVYFDYHISMCKRSEQSGILIYEPTRANICHLFDKSRHESVQANLDNYVYLTLEEHTRFDQLLYQHRFTELEDEFVNAWIIACTRMAKILPLVKENTKFKIKIQEYLESVGIM